MIFLIFVYFWKFFILFCFNLSDSFWYFSRFLTFTIFGIFQEFVTHTHTVGTLFVDIVAYYFRLTFWYFWLLYFFAKFFISFHFSTSSEIFLIFLSYFFIFTIFGIFEQFTHFLIFETLFFVAYCFRLNFWYLYVDFYMFLQNSVFYFIFQHLSKCFWYFFDIFHHFFDFFYFPIIIFPQLPGILSIYFIFLTYILIYS